MLLKTLYFGSGHAPLSSYTIFDALPPAGALARKIRELSKKAPTACGLSADEAAEGGESGFLGGGFRSKVKHVSIMRPLSSRPLQAR
jgi:hypothetical protein